MAPAQANERPTHTNLLKGGRRRPVPLPISLFYVPLPFCSLLHALAPGRRPYPFAFPTRRFPACNTKNTRFRNIGWCARLASLDCVFAFSCCPLRFFRGLTGCCTCMVRCCDWRGSQKRDANRPVPPPMSRFLGDSQDTKNPLHRGIFSLVRCETS